MNWFPVVKFIHVLAAITSVGINLSYTAWLAAAGEGPHLAFTLRGIQRLDRIANAGYGVLFVTGLLLAYLAGYSYTTPWIVTALVLFLGAGAVGGALFSRVFKRQLTLAETGAAASDEYRRAASLSQGLGLLVTVLVVAIVYLMVVKPGI